MLAYLIINNKRSLRWGLIYLVLLHASHNFDTTHTELSRGPFFCFKGTFSMASDIETTAVFITINRKISNMVSKPPSERTNYCESDLRPIRPIVTNQPIYDSLCTDRFFKARGFGP